jgi:hypothetical protein
LKKDFIIKTVAGLLFFLLGQAIHAQNQEDIRLNERFARQPLQDFIDTLETKYGLQVFYKNEWIENHTIQKDFQQTPLIQALNNIFLGSDLTFRFYQDNGVVIFPVKSDSRVSVGDASQLLIIGNPLNLGRYKSAVLKGKVVDGKTGEPLIGAVVYDAESQKGASTDENGLFTMELPTGDHRLRFSYMGFQPSNIKIRLIEDGYEEFDLFEETHNIAEVTVMGENADLPRSQMSMVQMSSRDIEELPALMGEVDVLKGMTMLAGVQTVGELASGFNVRGGNTDQNLILVNGSPVFNSSHLFGFLSLINPDVVDNVRLFKGGIPVKFGERVASVMEVDFKDGNKEAVRVYGGIGIINSRLTIDGPLTENKKLTFIAGGRSSYSNWVLQQVPELELSQSVTHFYDGTGKLTWKFDKHNRLSIMGYVSNDEFSTSAQSVNKYGNILANLEANTRLGEQLYGDLDVSHSRYNYRLTDYANGNPLESYYLDNSLEYSSASYHLRWHPHPQHNFVAGVKALSYLIRPGELTPVEEFTIIEPQVLNNENTLEGSVYVGDEYEILPGFSVAAGLRFSYFANKGQTTVYIYDENRPVQPENVVDSLRFGENEISKSYSGLEPRLSLNYDLDMNTSLKFNYQRVRQYVFQLSNNAVISPAETWKAADYHLKPLISDQIAVGVENDSWLENTDFSAEVYYKFLQNLIEYKNGAQLIMNEQVETALLPTNGYSYGIELSARKNFGRLTGYASYVFSRTMRKTESRFEEENFWQGNYYPSVYDKPHDFSITTNYDISRRWKFSANFVLISGRPVTLPEIKYEYAGEELVYFSDRNKYRMPPYHRLDLSITFDENLRKKRMWKGSWTFSIYNVYGRKNPYSVYYRKAQPGEENNYRRYSLYKLSVIGIPVPSLTYNFKF